ncbi:MAG: hypothetical protein QW760_06340, partial [Thermofilaceae archaeon]
VKGVNMVDPEGYSKLIERSQPRFVELKGYTWVGESQKRLPIAAMPTIQELEEFAKKIADSADYQLKLTDEKSRVVMLVRDEETWEWNLKLIEKQKRVEEEFDIEWRGKIRDFKLRTYVPPHARKPGPVPLKPG